MNTTRVLVGISKKIIKDHVLGIYQWSDPSEYQELIANEVDLTISKKEIDPYNIELETARSYAIQVPLTDNSTLLLSPFFTASNIRVDQYGNVTSDSTGTLVPFGVWERMACIIESNSVPLVKGYLLLESSNRSYYQCRVYETTPLWQEILNQVKLKDLSDESVIGVTNYAYFIDNDHTIAYTVDGYNFSTITVDSHPWTSICYCANNIIVICASDGVVYRSVDGMNFTQVYSTVSNVSWQDITYGHKGILIVSNGSKGLISNDIGATWTSITIPNYSWSSVDYGSGYYAAVARGPSNKSFFSTDLETFTLVDLPYTATWIDIKYGTSASNIDGNYYGVFFTMSWSDTSNSYAAVSQYGVNIQTGEIYVYWVDVTNNIPGAEWTSIATTGNTAVMIASNSNTAAYRKIGIWNPWVVTTLPFSGYWKELVYVNDIFIAVAQNSPLGAYSLDQGESWILSNLSSLNNPTWVSSTTTYSPWTGHFCIPDNTWYSNPTKELKFKDILTAHILSKEMIYDMWVRDVSSLRSNPRSIINVNGDSLVDCIWYYSAYKGAYDTDFDSDKLFESKPYEDPDDVDKLKTESSDVISEVLWRDKEYGVFKYDDMTEHTRTDYIDFGQNVIFPDDGYNTGFDGAVLTYQGEYRFTRQIPAVSFHFLFRAILNLLKDYDIVAYNYVPSYWYDQGYEKLPIKDSSDSGIIYKILDNVKIFFPPIEQKDITYPDVFNSTLTSDTLNIVGAPSPLSHDGGWGFYYNKQAFVAYNIDELDVKKGEYVIKLKFHINYKLFKSGAYETPIECVPIQFITFGVRAKYKDGHTEEWHSPAYPNLSPPSTPWGHINCSVICTAYDGKELVPFKDRVCIGDNKWWDNRPNRYDSYQFRWTGATTSITSGNYTYQDAVWWDSSKWANSDSTEYGKPYMFVTDELSAAFDNVVKLDVHRFDGTDLEDSTFEYKITFTVNTAEQAEAIDKVYIDLCTTLNKYVWHNGSTTIFGDDDYCYGRQQIIVIDDYQVRNLVEPTNRYRYTFRDMVGEEFDKTCFDFIKEICKVFHLYPRFERLEPSDESYDDLIAKGYSWKFWLESTWDYYNTITEDDAWNVPWVHDKVVAIDTLVNYDSDPEYTFNTVQEGLLTFKFADYDTDLSVNYKSVTDQAYGSLTIKNPFFSNNNEKVIVDSSFINPVKGSKANIAFKGRTKSELGETLFTDNKIMMDLESDGSFADFTWGLLIASGHDTTDSFLLITSPNYVGWGIDECWTDYFRLDDEGNVIYQDFYFTHYYRDALPNEQVFGNTDPSVFSVPALYYYDETNSKSTSLYDLLHRDTFYDYLYGKQVTVQLDMSQLPFQIDLFRVFYSFEGFIYRLIQLDYNINTQFAKAVFHSVADYKKYYQFTFTIVSGIVVRFTNQYPHTFGTVTGTVTNSILYVLQNSYIEFDLYYQAVIQETSPSITFLYKSVTKNIRIPIKVSNLGTSTQLNYASATDLYITFFDTKGYDDYNYHIRFENIKFVFPGGLPLGTTVVADNKFRIVVGDDTAESNISKDLALFDNNQIITTTGYDEGENFTIVLIGILQPSSVNPFIINLLTLDDGFTINLPDAPPSTYIDFDWDVDTVCLYQDDLTNPQNTVVYGTIISFPNGTQVETDHPGVTLSISSGKVVATIDPSSFVVGVTSSTDTVYVTAFLPNDSTTRVTKSFDVTMMPIRSVDGSLYPEIDVLNAGANYTLDIVTNPHFSLYEKFVTNTDIWAFSNQGEPPTDPNTKIVQDQTYKGRAYLFVGENETSQSLSLRIRIKTDCLVDYYQILWMKQVNIDWALSVVIQGPTTVQRGSSNGYTPVPEPTNVNDTWSWSITTDGVNSNTYITNGVLNVYRYEPLDSITIRVQSNHNTDVYATYNVAIVDPTPEPSIEISVDSSTKVQGSTFVFTSNADPVGGQYQWYVNGNAIEGADHYVFNYTSNTVGIANVYCVYTYMGPAVTSNTISIETTAPATIQILSNAYYPYVGELVTCTAYASPSGGTYQWRKDGYNLGGETNSTLQIGLQVEGTAEISCVYTYNGIPTTSNILTITWAGTPPVNIEIDITVDNANPQVYNDVTLTAYAYPSGGTYLWYLDNVALTYTTSSMTISSQEVGPHTFYCAYTYNGTTQNSNSIVVTWSEAPTPTGSITVVASRSNPNLGQVVTIDASLSGLSGGIYQWYKDGEHVGGNTNYISDSYNYETTHEYMCVYAISGTYYYSNVVSVMWANHSQLLN